ncbi:MAG: hypothetical protein ACOY0T_18330 [Myxococcota bacterium]
MTWYGRNGTGLCYMLLAVCLGCSGEDSDTSPDSTGGASDQRAFVPEGIQFESANSGFQSLVIEAATLRDSGSITEWLVSLRNTGQQLECGLKVAAVFSGLDGEELGVGIAQIQGTLHTDYSENGCLAAGEVGLGGLWVETKAAQVASILHQFQGYLPTDAMKIADVGIENVRVTSATASKGTLRGQFHNGSAEAIVDAAVYVFSLNAFGRPLARAVVRNSKPLAPGSDWAFEVSVPGPLEKYAAFASFPPQWQP